MRWLLLLFLILICAARICDVVHRARNKVFVQDWLLQIRMPARLAGNANGMREGLLK